MTHDSSAKWTTRRKMSGFNVGIVIVHSDKVRKQDKDVWGCLLGQAHRPRPTLHIHTHKSLDSLGSLVLGFLDNPPSSSLHLFCLTYTSQCQLSSRPRYTALSSSTLSRRKEIPAILQEFKKSRLKHSVSRQRPFEGVIKRLSRI